MLMFILLVALFNGVQGRMLVACDYEKMIFSATKRDLNGWAPNKIKLGKCELDEDYSAEADYEECGFSVQRNAKTIEVKTTLLSQTLRSVVSRKRPVELVITCSVKKDSRESADVSIKTVVGKIGGYVSRQGQKDNRAIDLRLNYLNSKGEIETENNLKNIAIGEEVSAVVTGPDLEGLGLRAAASDCFVSPDPIPNEKSLKYYLLRDMCPVDETLVIEDYGNGQLLKFKTFAFSQNKNGHLYLHCDILACTSKETCGDCIKKWKEISSTWVKAWNNRKRKTVMFFDVTTFMPLTRENIRCNKNGIKFMAKREDFPKWKGQDVYLGNCPLDENFSVFASYAECGIKTKERRHQVIMTTHLTGRKEGSKITRKRPIKYTIRCGYDRFTKQSSSVAVEVDSAPSLGSATKIAHNPVDLFLQVLDRNGFPYTKHVLEVELDERVEAVIGGNSLAQSNLYAYATDCFVTPTIDPNHNIRYDLLINSCAVDETFSVRRYGNGQKISFHSFAFTHDDEAKLYLHCDVIACLPQADCGVCQEEEPLRKKRHANTVAENFVSAAFHVY